MSTIIQDADVTLPVSGTKGELFFQIGVGPMMPNDAQWYYVGSA